MIIIIILLLQLVKLLLAFLFIYLFLKSFGILKLVRKGRHLLHCCDFSSLWVDSWPGAGRFMMWYYVGGNLCVDVTAARKAQYKCKDESYAPCTL